MKKFAALLLSLTTVTALARPIRGTYEVPASSDLTPFASFPVKFKSQTYDRDPVSLTFPLPRELTGTLNTVELKRSETDPSAWSGPQGSATCAKEGRFFVCHMKFEHLSRDPRAAEAYVLAQTSDPASAAAIIEVSRLFGSEGIGILRYKLRGGESD